MYIFIGTNRFFRKILSQCNIDCTFVDATKPENVQEAMKGNTKVQCILIRISSSYTLSTCICTKVVWIESCTNPTLQVIDVKAVADMVHKQKV